MKYLSFSNNSNNMFGRGSQSVRVGKKTWSNRKNDRPALEDWISKSVTLSCTLPTSDIWLHFINQTFLTFSLLSNKQHHNSTLVLMF